MESEQVTYGKIYIPSGLDRSAGRPLPGYSLTANSGCLTDGANGTPMEMTEQ